MKKILCGIVLAASANICSAQVEVVAPIVAGVVAKDVIGNLNDVLAARIGQAAASGDFLVEKTARQLQLLLTNADGIFKNNIDLTFDKLTKQQQDLLKTVSTMTNSLDNLKNATLDLESFAAMDLNTVLASIPGISGNQFLLKRIDGFSQTYRENGTYAVRLTGQAFGQNRRVSVMIDGTPIALRPFSTDNVATAEIPAQMINKYFADGEVKRINLKVKSWSKRSFLGSLVNGAEKLDLDYNAEILLLPKYPVSYEMLEITAGKGWSDTIKSISSTTLAPPTGSSGNWNRFLVSVGIPDDALMVEDSAKAWVASGISAGNWGNWEGPLVFSEKGDYGYRRVSRSFAHQIHDQQRILAIEVGYRSPVSVSGRSPVKLRDPITSKPQESILAFNKIYEGVFSPNYVTHYFRLKYFNGKEVTLMPTSANTNEIETTTTILKDYKFMTVIVKNPYEKTQ